MHDDEIPTVVYVPGLPRGVHVMRRGSGGLLAPILRLPISPSDMKSDGRQSPHGDFRGGVLVVSWQQNIPLRS